MKRFLCLSVLLLVSPLAASQATNPDCRPREKTVMLGDPGCYEGGCPDKSSPCKECRADGACWCSTCCVAARQRQVNLQHEDDSRKSNARLATQAARPDSQRP
jgi:hypothetical protein